MLLPVAGSKLQICFSRNTSSKTCWIVKCLLQLLQLNHPFVLGRFVRRPLLGGQIKFGVAIQLRRHVIHHHVFGATQDVVA